MRITHIRIKVTFFVFVAFIFCAEGFAQTENSKNNLLNVKDYKAVGDGKSDDTKAIQEAISKASEGDTVFIPEGIFLVKALGLKSKVHIKGEGLLVQTIDGEEEGFSPSKQNSSAPLFRGINISDVSLSFKARTKNEAVYLTGSKNMRIANSAIKGDSSKRESFAGILLYKCENISIENSTLSDYGTPREDPHTYQPGSAIRILSSNNVRVSHNEIFKNGENGIFIHDTPNVEVSYNRIQNNGMSGIQVAFGTSRTEKNYSFIGNEIVDNAADAIDINNRSTREFLDINCKIKNNISRNNGFVNGESTLDGSGLATLINVSGVEIVNNRAEGNNRPALYLESCGRIFAKGNKADNEVEVVLQFEELVFTDNSFSLLNILANVKGNKLLLTHNQLISMSLPNGIEVDSLILRKNLLTNATLNFNMKGNVILVENTINSHTKEGAVLIVRANSVHLESNIITSTLANALVIREMARKVTIINNDIKSINVCILDDGSKGLKIVGNKLYSLKGGRFRHTLVSRNPDGLVLSKNHHTSIKKENALRLEGPGTASIIGENIIKGYADYGSVNIIKE